MSLNRIVLIGRLTRDPEMKYTPQGIPVAQMGIAVDRISKDENGQKEVDFFDVVAWRRSAEFASNYLTKGRLVAIEGRLQTRSWVAQDGTKRKSYEIVADNLQGLDRKADGEGGEGSYAGSNSSGSTEGGSDVPAPRAAAPARTAAKAAAPADDDIDESDPFADE